MLNLSADNPAPFEQPFLELVLGGGGIRNIMPDSEKSEYAIVWIDVGGQIEKYIAKDNSPTERLIELCRSFAKAGVIVKDYARYVGSGGPNIIMRHGALFYRMRPVENPGAEVFAYEYREPKYRGPK